MNDPSFTPSPFDGGGYGWGWADLVLPPLHLLPCIRPARRGFAQAGARGREI